MIQPSVKPPIEGTAVVGLTGGIGSGKSTVGHIMEALGARRVDADRLARQAVEPPSPILNAIFQRFGPSVQTESGALDRAALGRIVFGSPADKQWLEGMIHPYVRERMTQAIADAVAASAPMIVLEVPLLFENRMHEWMHRSILVVAPQPQRLERVAERDGLPIDDIRARMAAQMPDEQKQRLADYVIDNSGSLEDLRESAEAVYNQILMRDRRT